MIRPRMKDRGRLCCFEYGAALGAERLGARVNVSSLHDVPTACVLPVVICSDKFHRSMKNSFSCSQNILKYMQQ